MTGFVYGNSQFFLRDEIQLKLKIMIIFSSAFWCSCKVAEVGKEYEIMKLFSFTVKSDSYTN